MRITNNMLTQNYLNNLERTVERMSQYQYQMSTGKRIRRVSDDPIGSISSLSIRTKISQLNQYQRNIDDAKAWLTQSETAITVLNNVIKNMYEKTVQAANGTQHTSEKLAIATELSELREHIVQLANSNYGNQYIFGGYQTDSQPITGSDPVLYQGMDLTNLTPSEAEFLNQQTRMIEIGPGLLTSVSIPGSKLLGTGSENIIQITDELIDILRAEGSTDEISPYILKLQKKQEDTLAMLTEIGGRINRLDLVNNRTDQDLLNYESVKSNIEDVDIVEAIMHLEMERAVYTSALSIGSSIILPSLADFLR